MIEITNSASGRFPVTRIKLLAEYVISRFGKRGMTVSIAFISSRKMARLNREYRGQNGTTDILAFSGEGDQLGEILLDYKKIKKNSERYHIGIREELGMVVVHGLLHLLGYRDNTEQEQEKMIKLGKKIIGDFNKR